MSILRVNAVARVCVLALLTCGQTAVPSTLHQIAPSPDDAFLRCASRLLGRRTLRHTEVPRVSLDVPCGESRQDFDAALSAANLMVTDAGEWLIVNPKTDLDGRRPMPFAWKHVRIVPSIEHRPSRNGLPLASDELEAIGRRAIASSRLTPIGFPARVGEQYDVELLVGVDAVRLRPDVDSIVVVLGFPPSMARLVYGERRSGQYVPLWDSPILSTRGGDLGWRYEDVDHDGRSEIVVWGSEQPSYRTLVIFDLDGKELTRNGDCFVTNGAITNTNPTCPIVGQRVEIEDSTPDERRPRDIFVYQEDARDNQRFRLKNGIYVPFGRPPAP